MDRFRWSNSEKVSWQDRRKARSDQNALVPSRHASPGEIQGSTELNNFPEIYRNCRDPIYFILPLQPEIDRQRATTHSQTIMTTHQ
ncbi:MAG: hypothetical protein ACRC67_36470 [Inquilinus sp.]|uniref:hypothetical protein n=1 Tax=Inquilinus sp. TaxID=1932117 RepID=UPI003F32D548